MNILIAILTLTLLIALHELGHFLVAKKFDVKVEEFGIGLPIGPRLVSKKIGETVYSITMVPLGGFVRMFGEMENIDDERSFSAKPVWQRALIVVAGVVVTWFLAIFIFTITAFSFGIFTGVEDDAQVEEAVLMAGFNLERNFEQEVWEELKEIRPEEIRPEDRIYKVNGEEVTKVSEFKEKLKEGKGRVTFLRGDNEIEVDFSGHDPEKVVDALSVVRLTQKELGISDSIRYGIVSPIQVIETQVLGLTMLVRDFLGTEEMLGGEGGIMGPVGVGARASEMLSYGMGDYLMFVGLIATILAVMNLLPIPALDGGRLLFLFIEKLKGSPIPKKTEAYVNGVFMILLLSFMAIIVIRDIVKLL